MATASHDAARAPMHGTTTLPTRAIATLACLGALAACDAEPSAAPGVVELAPDAARTGVDGEPGPFGAARVTLTVQARVSESFPTEVVFPARADGALAPTDHPYPAVVFVHGGLVPAPRYRWVATHLASRGYVVIAPAHALDLAIFETDNAWLALEAVRRAASASGRTLTGAIDPRGRAAVMGHSLGGVVAARQWIAGGFDAVALFAAFPAEGDPVARRAGAPVLSLVGGNDQRAPPTRVRAGFEAFAAPRWFGLVADMNHYDWTDDATADELRTDGPRAPDLAQARRAALAVLDAFLDAALRDDPAARARLDAPTFAGATVTR